MAPGVPRLTLRALFATGVIPEEKVSTLLTTEEVQVWPLPNLPNPHDLHRHTRVPG